FWGHLNISKNFFLTLLSVLSSPPRYPFTSLSEQTYLFLSSSIFPKKLVALPTLAKPYLSIDVFHVGL
ncbi:hypothetical protein ACEE86_23525, partial [Proteus mirabilis]